MTEHTPLYSYRGQLDPVGGVHDGDTVWILCDLGFYISLRIKVRLARSNAPELSTPAGLVARQFVVDWFASHPIVALDTKPYPGDRYGRWLGEIVATDPSGANLINDLIASGNAVPWDGKGPKPGAL